MIRLGILYFVIRIITMSNYVIKTNASDVQNMQSMSAHNLYLGTSNSCYEVKRIPYRSLQLCAFNVSHVAA